MTKKLTHAEAWEEIKTHMEYSGVIPTDLPHNIYWPNLGLCEVLENMCYNDIISSKVRDQIIQDLYDCYSEKTRFPKVIFGLLVELNLE